MADYTKFTRLNVMELRKPLQPHVKLASQKSPGDTSISFDAPFEDKDGNIPDASYGTIFGIKSNNPDNEEYVEICYVAPGDFASDGKSATIVDGIPPSGKDFTTTDTDFQATHDKASIVKQPFTAIQYNMIQDFILGDIPSGAATFQVGDSDVYTTKIATVQTTDATVTDIATISVAEGEVYHVEADIIGRKSDGTDRASYKLIGTFYRNSAGNVTLQGSVTADHSIESNASWNATMVADTGNQTIDIQVTGVAATTVNWTCVYKYFKET